MVIAVTYQDGMIFGHFGKSQEFKIYEIENGAVANSKVVDVSNIKGRDARTEYLKSLGSEVLICGGICEKAQAAVSACGIKIYAANSGSADEAVNKYLTGALTQVTGKVCDHHSEDNNHSCS